MVTLLKQVSGLILSCAFLIGFSHILWVKFISLSRTGKYHHSLRGGGDIPQNLWDTFVCISVVLTGLALSVAICSCYHLFAAILDL